MDTQFLEFWGHFLISAAKGQRQMEDAARWLSQGMSGVEDLTAMFRRFYGLGGEPAGGGETWETARRSFETAFRAYLAALGCVPRSDYDALQRQLEELRQTAGQQEAALRKLRQELGESRMAQGDVVRGFQELIQVQSDQFRELTDSFSRLVSGR
jgi:hypothetical protein